MLAMALVIKFNISGLLKIFLYLFTLISQHHWSLRTQELHILVEENHFLGWESSWSRNFLSFSRMLNYRNINNTLNMLYYLQSTDNENFCPETKKFDVTAVVVSLVVCSTFSRTRQFKKELYFTLNHFFILIDYN